jgi:two-component system LytT family response regulator
MIAGFSNDPLDAIEEIRKTKPDVLFLDIHMPGLSGFDLLGELDTQPMVVFTTAYDKYALDAFKVNSIDYLLKPIEPEHLQRALDKIARMRSQARQDVPDLRRLLAEIGASFEAGERRWLSRIASRTGDKLEPIDVQRVTHFFSRDKLTFAATAERNYVVDFTIGELETKLDPARFVRIHRATILNLDFLLDLRAMFGGRMVARLKGAAKTELAVSRDRVAVLKERLGA